jgi:hypothetical protein
VTNPIFKTSQQQISSISPEERDAAKKSINSFNELLRRLKGARNADKTVINILEKNKDADPSELFKIRHLLRRFQNEVKERYTSIIIAFAGKKNDKMQTVTKGYIHNLEPLLKDTMLREIKITISDSMQQLTEFMEEFLSEFEKFNNPNQITEIIRISSKADAIISSIENIIEKQLTPYLQKNVLQQKVVTEFRGQIIKRAWIIKLLENL